MSDPHPKISVTGDIGSGKSAVCRLLSEATGFAVYSTGAMQREIAARRGMSTLELNRYSETHPEIDEEIDAWSAALGRRAESLIVDSRIAWHFVPCSFKVYLTVEPRIAAERILGDGRRQGERYADVDEAMRDIRRRRESEIERFRDTYGLDLGDLTQFDLVVDTTTLAPREVAVRVLEAFRAWC